MSLLLVAQNFFSYKDKQEYTKALRNLWVIENNAAKYPISDDIRSDIALLIRDFRGLEKRLPYSELAAVITIINNCFTDSSVNAVDIYKKTTRSLKTHASQYTKAICAHMEQLLVRLPLPEASVSAMTLSVS